MSRSTTISVEEILSKAATSQITAQELNVLVEKTRELRASREQELTHLKTLLSELEAMQNSE